MHRKQLSVVLASVLLAAGCGSSSGGDANAKGQPAVRQPAKAAKAAATKAATSKLDITIGEMFVRTSSKTVAGGDITFTATNSGKVAHELIFLETDKDATSFVPTKGRIDESSAVAQMGDFTPGLKKSKVIHLAPGHYVLVCNIAGHYMAGMRANLTVT